MAITVKIIEEKEFSTKVRGYDKVEVDEFLDDICDEMVILNNTIQQLRDQLKQQQQAPAPFMPAVTAPPAPLSPIASSPKEPSLPNDLEAAKALLEKTQQACDEVLAQAKSRAEAVRLKAEKEVAEDSELLDLEARKEELLAEIKVLEADSQKFKLRFQTMLKDQIDILESELP